MRDPVSLRRTSRHAIRAKGQVVDAETFTLLGDKVLEASAEGCLLACDAEAKVGQRVYMTFQMPDGGRWFDISHAPRSIGVLAAPKRHHAALLELVR